MNFPIPILPSMVWDVLAAVRTVFIYAFPFFMLYGFYTERRNVEQMIVVWGGVYALLTLPAAIVVGTLSAMVAVAAPLVLSVVLAAFAVVLRGAATGYIDAAHNARATKEENQ